MCWESKYSLFCQSFKKKGTFDQPVCFEFDRVGRNVAAGMTGGLAYILDEDDTLIPKVCPDGNHSPFYFTSHAYSFI